MISIQTKKILTLFISVLFCYFLNGQTTIILQPNGSNGKDAYVDSRYNNNNYGSHVDFAAMSWTNGGVPSDARSLIDFDFSSIPAGATINSASLSLYSYNSPANGSHSTLSGSNESVLLRITSSWDENTVTWNSQPSTTTQNQVILPESTSPIQNYLNIDVTILIEDMLNDPANSHGFLLKLINEEYYRSMIFASSDNNDLTLHPKLEITYTEEEPDICVTFRPNDSLGKDAYIDSRYNSNNYGSHVDFAAMSWTNGGVPSDARGLIDFDFSSIPVGASITSANLSLYSYNSPANGSHSTISGSNESVLLRITDSWEENTVTWNNQPSTTTQNQVILPASTSSIQDYLNIDVTNLVDDMIVDPNNSYGFLFKLTNEDYYRSMIFASSDNGDTTLHPKLEVCYLTTASLPELISSNNEIYVFPNPTSGFLNVEVDNTDSNLMSIAIISSTGQTLEHKTNIDTTAVFDLTNYSKGVYFVKATFNNFISTRKVIVQ